MSTIALACDHGGYELMQIVREYLDKNGYAYKNFGTNSLQSCDYPEMAIPAAKAIAAGECEKGIFICTTGNGIAMTANKIAGIRAALCTNVLMAEMTRDHNDANVLALGAIIVDSKLALEIVEKFLTTEFSGAEKHCRRVNRIKSLDREGG